MVAKEAILRVNHVQSNDGHVSLGRDVESQVMAPAVHAHVNGGVFINGHKTVVFAASPGTSASERIG